MHGLVVVDHGNPDLKEICFSHTHTPSPSFPPTPLAIPVTMNPARSAVARAVRAVSSSARQPAVRTMSTATARAVRTTAPIAARNPTVSVFMQNT